MSGDITHTVDAAEQHCFFIAPGEARAEVSVPGIASRRLLRSDLDADVENRPAQPGAKCLPKCRQYLFLVAQDRSFADNFAQSRAGRDDLDLFCPQHGAAGVEDELLSQP